MMERIGFMLRQSINLDGIRGFGSAMIHPSLLRPSLGHYHRVNDIDIADLHKTQGIKALVFDKDNTLTLPFHDVYFDKAVDEFMQKCKEVRFETYIAIFTLFPLFIQSRYNTYNTSLYIDIF
jgi:menaquinone-dependent protoporphyrinogen IX oxidase